jgi:ABC-type dipeptide/oligopeptide/nickel transport system permease component
LVVCFVVVNLVVDVISWILDPRMRSDDA